MSASTTHFEFKLCCRVCKRPFLSVKEADWEDIAKPVRGWIGMCEDCFKAHGDEHKVIEEALRQIDSDMDLLNAEWVTFRSRSRPFPGRGVAAYNETGAEIDIAISRIGSNIAKILKTKDGPTA